MNVCFWFIPPSLRGKEGNADYQNKLAKVSFCIVAISNWDLNCIFWYYAHSYLSFVIFSLFVGRHYHLLNITDICVLLIGSSNNQGAYDERRHFDGGLSASWRHGQLFPCDCLFPTCFPQRHGLLSWWNRATWKRFVIILFLLLRFSLIFNLGLAYYNVTGKLYSYNVADSFLVVCRSHNIP